MSDGDNTIRDLILFLLFLFVAGGVLWVLQGGPEGESGGLFLDMKNFRVSGISSDSSGVSENGESSVVVEEDIAYEEHKRFISINKRSVLKTNPNEEYIEIVLSRSSKNPVNITGWTIENREGFSLKIPQVVNLFVSGKENINQDIVLQPGGKIVVVTGEGALGYSFRLNKCFGYFGQTRSFIPVISQECPYPKNEVWPELTDKCLDYIDALPRCRVASFSYETSLGLGNDCIESINSVLGYNNCTRIHQKDSDFYRNEWRVYLNRNQELWKESRKAVVILKNRNGDMVKSISY